MIKLLKNIEIVELKGNEINKELWKSFKQEMTKKTKRFEVYSDEEEAYDEDYEEDEASDLADSLNKVNLDK